MDLEKDPAACQSTDKILDECRVYKRRWIVLGIFVLCSASNAFQWIQYSIIANMVMKYYKVESFDVDWTSMVYMITYIPLIFPASWLLDRVGLRWVIIIGALGTCGGAWIKVFSVAEDLFFVTMIGQTLVGMSQVFVLGIPPRLAAVWFGSDQVSSATSIGVFGNQMGVAIGFLLPPIIVRDHDKLEDIGTDFKYMFYGVAIFTSVLLLVVLFIFEAQPPIPPSLAQVNQRSGEKENFGQILKGLALNPGYIILLISYGINVGVFYAISTLLNQVVLVYYPGREMDVGRIGLCIVVAGMCGSVCGGFILDKTHRFKETTLGLYIFSLLGMITFSFTMDCGYIWVVYLTSILLGFFMTGYLPVGFELAAELTYPAPEGTSSGMLNAGSQIFGLLFTMAYARMIKAWGDLWANGTMCLALLIGVLLTLFIKPDLRRQKAQNTNVAGCTNQACDELPTN